MKGYTLVSNSQGGTDRFEALYSRGKRIAESDAGGFSAADVIDALSMDNIAIQVEYVDVSEEYDTEVIANGGWPEKLEDIPAEERVL